MPRWIARRRDLLMAISILATTQGAHAEVTGISLFGVLYDINQQTGGVSNPRNTGLVGIVDIETTPDGTMYGILSQPDSPLLIINPLDGSAREVGLTGMLFGEGDMAFNPDDGMMYAINSFGSGDLMTIDLRSGIAKSVGIISGPPDGIVTGDFSAMAFDDRGNLFALDNLSGLLYQIDPTTAQVVNSVDTGIIYTGSSAAAGMDFDPLTGKFLVGLGQGFSDPSLLYSLDPFSGDSTLIGSMAISRIAGLTAIPAPATMFVFLTFAGVRRRRRDGTHSP